MGPPSWVKTFAPRGAALWAAAGLAVICYLNTCGNRLVFDDIDIIGRNPLVTASRIDLAAIFTSHYWAHMTPQGDLYRPLVILSYAVNHAIGGLDPAGYHAVNILLHALCSALVVALGARFGLTGGGALAAGLLFAAHPIHTEAVAGLVGRAELMSAAAVLAAWAIHMRPAPSTRGARWAVAGLLAAGLLSKENAAVLPGLMLAGDLWRVRRGETGWRRVAASYLACGAVLAVWLVVRAVLLEPYPPGSGYEGPFEVVPALPRIWTALAVMGRYIGLLVRPIVLSADYSFEQIPIVTSWTGPSVLGSAALLIAMLFFGAGRLARSSPPRADGLFVILFLVAIAPVSNLIVPIGTIMGERLVYLPSAGFCLVLPLVWEPIGRALSRVSGTRFLGGAAAILLTVLYCARTVQRNRDWKDQLTLFSVTTVTSPRSAKAHYNLGVALEEAGRKDEALKEYLTAVSIKPFDAKAHHNAGLLLAAAGRAAEASFHLDQASRLDPGLPKVFVSLGAALSHLGRHGEAEAAFRTAIEKDPADHTAWYNLGTLSLMKGDSRSAVASLERARDIDPNETDGRYQLGLAYLTSGRAREAVPEMRAALALSPDLAEAHLQLALALLQLGDRPAAAEEAARARAGGLELPPDLRRLVGEAGRE